MNIIEQTANEWASEYGNHRNGSAASSRTQENVLFALKRFSNYAVTCSSLDQIDDKLIQSYAVYVRTLPCAISSKRRLLRCLFDFMIWCNSKKYINAIPRAIWLLNEPFPSTETVQWQPAPIAKHRIKPISRKHLLMGAVFI